MKKTTQKHYKFFSGYEKQEAALFGDVDLVNCFKPYYDNGDKTFQHSSHSFLEHSLVHTFDEGFSEFYVDGRA